MKKIIISSIAFSLIGYYFLVPISVSAKTVRDYENEVSKYTAEIEEKQKHIAKNDAEVAEITRRIANIQSQISQAESDIETLENEINASNKKIKEKGEESKKIIEYYQLSSGENSYLQYIFGATSITDMIYRISMTEQLTEYNDKIMKELKELIVKNKEKQKQLNTKKQELNSLQAQLKTERQKINADTKAVRDTMPSVQEQLKAAKASLASLKKMGCGANEEVERCIARNTPSGSIPSTGSTLRPTLVGTRNGGLYSYSGHVGQDIGSPNKKNETIYPVASGLVVARYNDNCRSFCRYKCNGNANIVVIKHNINGKMLYTSYVHLSQVYVSNGQTVSAYTPIGKMGNTGCTDGGDEGGTYIHLHLEMATCHWNATSECGGNYNKYLKSIVNPTRYVTLPASWTNR